MYKNENLQVPEELMSSFSNLAKERIASISTEGLSLAEIYEKFYTQALVDNFMRNNGIPTIPFPISLSTVDMVCIAESADGVKIMFGRKPGQPKWQFPGGFRDPKETSRFAATRELNEEANLVIPEERLEHIGELFVDDIRYRHTPHKITTQIYLCRLTEEEVNLASPGDDLGELEFYSMEQLLSDTSIIREIHIPIFNVLVSYLGLNLTV